MNSGSIIKACAEAFHVQESQILGRRKCAPFVAARMAAAWLLRVKANASPDEVASLFSRSRAWASWAYWACEERGEVDKAFAARVQKAVGLLEREAA
jgi:chromosomal replication initiation ATPase DnaA